VCSATEPHEVDVLNKSFFYFAAAVDIVDVGVYHHLQQHAGMIGAGAARLVFFYNSTNVYFLQNLIDYPLFQAFRIARLKEIKPFDGWIALNWGSCILFTAAVWYFLGPKAVGFLTLSFFFSVGLHPLGGRWIQEHYLVHGEQETYSYYGPLNKVAFNVGYHNEHHDFPSIPWNKLPQVRKQASSFYDTLHYHTSWTKLFFRFLFDQELSLWSRIVRKNRGKVALTDQSKPDTDILILEAKEEKMAAAV
jgi:sphingolipid delta-4 desaturase